MALVLVAFAASIWLVRPELRFVLLPKKRDLEALRGNRAGSLSSRPTVPFPKENPCYAPGMP